ncbi:MAG: endonuclease/exonuclease/phosphatase family protein [bacterium]
MINDKVNTLKLASYNLRNLFDNIDDPLKNDGPPKKESEIAGIGDIIRRSNADIVALQEVENIQILTKLLETAGLKDKYNVIVGKSDERGIATALLVSKKFKIKNYTINENNEVFKRPPVEALIEIMPGFQVKVFTVHLKSKRGGVEADKQRYKEVENLIQKTKNTDTPTIIMGDFNDLPDSITIKTLESNGFTDVRNLDKMSRETKYPTYYGKYKSVLDYIFVSKHFNESVVQRSFNVVGRYEYPNVHKFSDHRMIEIQLNLEKVIRNAL